MRHAFLTTLVMLAAVTALQPRPGLASEPALPRHLPGGWVEATGEAVVVHVTPTQARRIALERARSQAVAFACGIEVASQAYQRRGEQGGRLEDTFLTLSDVRSVGRIVEEKPVVWDVSTTTVGALPTQVYRARLQARVAADDGARDPGFRVTVTLDQSRYADGDPMVVIVTTTKPCYVSVLNVTARDSVTVLAPHRLRPQLQLEAGDTLRLPDTDERDMGVVYRVSCPADQANVVELIKVVATRDPHDLRSLTGMPAAGALIGRTLDLHELTRWLLAIPRARRAEAAALYEVTKGRDS